MNFDSSIKHNRALLRFVALLVAFATLAIGYIGIEKINSKSVLASIKSVFRDDQALTNTTTLNRRFADMEALGLLSCVTISSDLLGQFYSTSFKKNCEPNYRLNKLWAIENAKIVSLSGESFEVSFNSHSGPIVIYTFVLLCIAGVSLSQGALSLYWQRIDAQERINKELGNRVEEQSSLIAEMKVNSVALTRMADLSLQVAHDIKSPLSALKIVTSTIGDLNPEKVSLLRSAADRIESIASDLLKKSKMDRASAIQKTDVVAALQNLIEEKKVAISPLRKISLHRQDSSKPICPLDLVTFQRIFSNLINNSIESLGQHGHVEIFVSSNDENVFVRVADNGKGIPPEILGRVGDKGFTYGKDGDGNGLGLYNARTILSHIGGSIEISSNQGIGTSVLVVMPLANHTSS